MSNNKKSLITTSTIAHNLPTTNINIGNQKPIFLFTNFHGNSIRIRGFNNYYKNQIDSVKAVYNLIETIKEMEKLTINELFEASRQRKTHCHLIASELEVNRIETVLKDGYKVNAKTIENFEKHYYQFALKSGERVICIKTDNYIQLLFIDNNHMIYKESSRDLKIKEIFEYPSCFGKINFEQDFEEYNTLDIVRMLIEDYKNGQITDLAEFVEQLQEAIDDTELVKI